MNRNFKNRNRCLTMHALLLTNECVTPPSGRSIAPDVNNKRKNYTIGKKQKNKITTHTPCEIIMILPRKKKELKNKQEIQKSNRLMWVRDG